MRRVVVTGMGMVSPLGCGVETTWSKLIEGRSGIKYIDRFDVSDLAAKVGGLIPMGKDDPLLFDADRFVPPKDQRKMDDFIIYAMAAAQMAVEDAGIAGLSDEVKERIGVMVGSGIGGLGTIEDAAVVLKEQGPRRISPFFIPSSLVNLASGHVSIKYGFKGPNHSAVTACATGAHAIGDAARLIQFEDADVMVAGGTEAAICRLGIAGFAASRALCTSFNDRPTEASRPWSKDRDGFVMGEGSGVVILEELEHARKRGAKIYAELVGYGLSGDAYHITAPAEDGNGAFRCMKAAM
ncbi:MAG: beta-ketoacyl-ACP synthase II, partial [Rhodospirillales bacterium]